MSNSENAVKMAASLYEARDFLRSMTTPEEYKARISEYQGYIREGMAKWNMSEIQSMMKLAGALRINPIAQAGLFAAYVEMIEPSDEAVQKAKEQI